MFIVKSDPLIQASKTDSPTRRASVIDKRMLAKSRDRLLAKYLNIQVPQ